jgi:hypothetical protein
MRTTFRLVAILSVAALLNSCSKDDDTKGTTGLTYSYFPVNVGHELIYDVELITKDEFSQIEDTVYYQLREVVESVFTDNQGRPTQRLERYTRPTDSDPWVISDVWTSNISSTLAEKKEENNTYIKLTFPVRTNRTWDGNSKNNQDELLYEYIEADIPGSVGPLAFDSTLTVLQEDEDNFIEKKYSVERYATNVGLIYKEQIDILKDYTNPSNPGVKAQRLYKETLVSWSN